MTTTFTDRRQAGRLLAAELGHYRGDAGVLVLALPRGGVPVAHEVALALNAPLDVLVVRKLGAPGHRELAVGAIASGGARVLNEDVVRWLRLDDATLDRIAADERQELARREALYRGDEPALSATGRTVILVDDGVATGATMLVALEALRQLGAGRLVVAVPVGAPDSLARLDRAADEVVCLSRPSHLVSVGQWYDDFSQTTDAEVRALLTR
jgi:predicted phosphoribosyltransferase